MHCPGCVLSGFVLTLYCLVFSFLCIVLDYLGCLVVKVASIEDAPIEEGNITIQTIATLQCSDKYWIRVYTNDNPVLRGQIFLNIFFMEVQTPMSKFSTYQFDYLLYFLPFVRLSIHLPVYPSVSIYIVPSLSTTVKKPTMRSSSNLSVM